MLVLAFLANFTTSADKVEILFKEYDPRLGKPVEGMAERLQVYSRKVLLISNWFDCFNLVRFSAPKSVYLRDCPRKSIACSGLNRYLDFTIFWKRRIDIAFVIDLNGNSLCFKILYEFIKIE